MKQSLAISCILVALWLAWVLTHSAPETRGILYFKEDGVELSHFVLNPHASAGFVEWTDISGVKKTFSGVYRLDVEDTKK